MKKLFLFVLISNCCLSQVDLYRENPDLILRETNRGNSYFFNREYFEFAPLNKRQELQIKKVTITHLGKKGKKYISEMEFNSRGLLTASKNPGRKSEFQARFQDDSLQVYSLTKRKNHTTEMKREFLNGKKIREEKIKDGKLDYIMEIAYTDFGKISESNMTIRKKRAKMIYEYNDKNALIKNSYFKNGKLKKSWNYECKPEGALEASNKTEIVSSKCEYREESNDGSYIIYERTLYRGIPHLEERKFTKDSVLYESNSYIHDSIPIRSWSKSGEWHLDISYRKGKINYQTKYRYNSKGQLLEYQSFHKNALAFSSKHTYDANGNCILTESIRPKEEKPYYVRRSVFNADGTMQSEEAYYKDKLSYKRFYEYTF